MEREGEEDGEGGKLRQIERQSKRGRFFKWSGKRGIRKRGEEEEKDRANHRG